MLDHYHEIFIAHVEKMVDRVNECRRVIVGAQANNTRDKDLSEGVSRFLSCAMPGLIDSGYVFVMIQ